MKLTLQMFCLTCIAGLGACGGGGNPGQTFMAAGPSAQAGVTTGDRTRLLAPQAAVSFGTGGRENSPIISVTETTQYQALDGFGASLTASAAWVIWNDLDA